MKIILIICLFPFCELSAQLNDSTIRKYFVCERRGDFRHSKIVKEGQKIMVRDASGKHQQGILTIINDTLFEVYNWEASARDTFNINGLEKVRKPTLTRQIGSAFLIISGLAVSIKGISLIIDSKDPTSSGYNKALDEITGYFLLISGLAPFSGGIISAFTGNMYSVDYDFRIIQTKGFELKKKDIKHL